MTDEISDESRFHGIHSSRSCLELDPSCTLPNSPFTKTSNATAAEGASTPSLNTLLKFQSWSHRSTIAHSDRDAYSAYCVALGSLYYRCGGTLSMLLSVSMFWIVVNQNVNQCWTTGQSDFLVRDWLMMLMMSSTNGGFERRKVKLRAVF